MSPSRQDISWPGLAAVVGVCQGLYLLWRFRNSYIRYIPILTHCVLWSNWLGHVVHLKCPWRIAIAAHAANLLHLKTQGFIAHEINSNLLRLQCPSFSLPKPLVWCKFASFQSRIHPSSPSNPHVYPSACSINARIIAGEVQVQASKSKSHRFLLEKMKVRCPNDNSKSKSLSNHWCMHHSLLSLHDRLVSIQTRPGCAEQTCGQDTAVEAQGPTPLAAQQTVQQYQVQVDVGPNLDQSEKDPKSGMKKYSIIQHILRYYQHMVMPAAGHAMKRGSYCSKVQYSDVKREWNKKI